MTVYFDASPRKNELGIGVYCETTNEHHSLTFPIKTKEIHMAEFIAFREAVRLYPNASQYYTDNKGIATCLSSEYPLSWIPRDGNRTADSLSKPKAKSRINISPNIPVTNIARAIASYSLKTKLNLWKRFAYTDSDRIFIAGIFLRKEVPECLYRTITPDLLKLILSTYSKIDNIPSSIVANLYAPTNGRYVSFSDKEMLNLLSSLK